MTKMHATTLVTTPATRFATLTRSDGRWSETVRVPTCDSRGIVESGEMGGPCSADLTCMCDTCVSIDGQLAGAVTRAASSVRMAPVSARLASVARPAVQSLAMTTFVLGSVLVTGATLGALVGFMLAGLVR